jgi:hypothetical protein
MPAVNPFGTATAFVVDVVGRAGRIVARVNREHGISTFAESVVRFLYDFSYFYKVFVINKL